MHVDHGRIGVETGRVGVGIGTQRFVLVCVASVCTVVGGLTLVLPSGESLAEGSQLEEEKYRLTTRRDRLINYRLINALN